MTSETTSAATKGLSRRAMFGAVAGSTAAAVLLGSTVVAAPAAVAASPTLDGAAYLTANDMTIATGTPSLVMWNHSSIYLPVWSMSGGTIGQSIVGVVTGLSSDAVALQVELIATSLQNGAGYDTAFRAHVAELVDGSAFESEFLLGAPVSNAAPGAARRVVTYTLQSSYTLTQPGSPIWVRIQREPGDAGDTFTSPMGVIAVRIVPIFDV